jgi:hypothetical protein
MRNLFTLVGALAVYATQSAVAAEALDLNTFLGRDLRKTNSTHVGNLAQFLETQSRIAHSGRKILSPQPWFVWKSNISSIKDHFVVFEGQPLLATPSTSLATVHVFDATARHLSSCTFSTGWRLELKSASFVKSPSLRTRTIEVRCEPERPKSIRSVRQIYGFVGARLTLIRLEGPKGKIRRNTYIYPNQT